MHQLKEKLERASGSLEGWGRETFGHVQREIKDLQGRLTVLRAAMDCQGPSYEEEKVHQCLLELYQREEVMWLQRSRVQWLAKGDTNTRFFHLRASQRKKRNKNCKLKVSDGVATKNEEVMANLTQSFYEDLYRSEGVVRM
jgi:hypothetical protein